MHLYNSIADTSSLSAATEPSRRDSGEEEEEEEEECKETGLSVVTPPIPCPRHS
jgi:hypothetical protein